MVKIVVIKAINDIQILLLFLKPYYNITLPKMYRTESIFSPSELFEELVIRGSAISYATFLLCLIIGYLYTFNSIKDVENNEILDKSKATLRKTVSLNIISNILTFFSIFSYKTKHLTLIFILKAIAWFIILGSLFLTLKWLGNVMYIVIPDNNKLLEEGDDTMRKSEYDNNNKSSYLLLLKATKIFQLLDLLTLLLPIPIALFVSAITYLCSKYTPQ